MAGAVSGAPIGLSQIAFVIRPSAMANKCAFVSIPPVLADPGGPEAIRLRRLVADDMSSASPARISRAEASDESVSRLHLVRELACQA